MSELPMSDRVLQLLQVFGILNGVMTIAEIEALKAEIFKELAIVVPQGEGVESMSPLTLLGSMTEDEEI